MWEKEKSQVTTNFSFSHSVFHPFGELSATIIQFEIGVYKLFQSRRVEDLSLGKGLKIYNKMKINNILWLTELLV